MGLSCLGPRPTAQPVGHCCIRCDGVGRDSFDRREDIIFAKDDLIEFAYLHNSWWYCFEVGIYGMDLIIDNYAASTYVRTYTKMAA